MFLGVFQVYDMKLQLKLERKKIYLLYRCVGKVDL